MKVRRIKRHGELRYQFGLGIVGTRRVQKTFRTKQEAEFALEKAKKQQKAESVQGLSLSEGDRVRFLEAREKLSKVGATIEAVTFLLAHTKPEAESLPVRELARLCASQTRGKQAGTLPKPA